MRDEQLEQRIRDAVDHAVPDVLADILSACGGARPLSLTEREAQAPAKTPRKRRRGPWAAAAVLALCCCAALGILQLRTANAVDSLVTLDVNPSLTISVNRRETVLAVTPLNEDARTVIGEMAFKGVPLDVTVNALVGSMLQNGYLDDLQNAILVSVENADAARSAAIQRQVTQAIGGILQDGAVLTQTVAEEDGETAALAEAWQISYGKAALVREAAALDPTLRFEDLAPLSVTEIALIMDSRHIAAAVTTTGSASDKAYIGGQAAAAAAYAHAGVTAADVTKCQVEFDSEDGLMVYEVEFDTWSWRCEYDINASTGEVVKWERESRQAAPPEEDDRGDDDDSPGPPPVSGGYVGAEAAKAAALDHAGFAPGQVQELEVKLEEDDGVTRYEVEFQADGAEYEYEVDAGTGVVLRWEADD